MMLLRIGCPMQSSRYLAIYRISTTLTTLRVLFARYHAGDAQKATPETDGGPSSHPKDRTNCLESSHINSYSNVTFGLALQ